MAFQFVPNPSTDCSGHISRSKSQDVVSLDQTTASSRPLCIAIRPRTGHAQLSAGKHIQREDISSGHLWRSFYPGVGEYLDKLGRRECERISRKYDNDAKSRQVLRQGG